MYHVRSMACAVGQIIGREQLDNTRPLSRVLIVMIQLYEVTIIRHLNFENTYVTIL